MSTDTNFKVLMTLMGLETGGAETHVLELCKGLSRRGVQVYVASNGGAYVGELEECGVKHYRVPLHNKRPDNVFKAYFALKRIITENGIRLVHAHARIPAFLCGLLSRRLNIRFVTTAHWIFKTDFPFNVLTNWGERSLAVSDDIKRYLIDSYSVPPEHIKVTINGVDTNKFSPDTDWSPLISEFSLDTAATRIVSISRLDSDRSLVAHQLAEAAEELCRKVEKLEIILVGGGDDFDNVARKAERVNKKLGRRVVIMTGPRVDVNLFAACADVFVNVSRSALEAMASARPVIVAGNEGYIGIFGRDKLDVCVSTNFCCRGCGQSTVERLTKDILSILELPVKEREALGLFGRETVWRSYSIDRMTADALDLYEGVRRSQRPVDVMISGYYGFNNNGDDAVLKSIVEDLKRIKPGAEIIVLSKKPAETGRVYGVRSLYRFNIFSINRWLKRTNTLISGGGSLIQDVTSTQSLYYYLWIIHCAMKKGARVMLDANGIGPVRRDGNAAMVKKVLNNVDLITLRDDNSLDALKDLGVTKPPVFVTADAAFSLVNTGAGETERKLSALGLGDGREYFCVAVRSWKYLNEGFDKELAAFADHMAERHGLTALFIPMQPLVDTSVSRRIMSFMKSGGVFFGADYTTNEVLGVIERARFIVAMRLHTIIYAVRTATPIIGIVYDPKVEAVMEAVGQKTHVKASEVNREQLIEYGHAVALGRERISEEIRRCAESFGGKAAQNAEMAAELLEKREF